MKPLILVVDDEERQRNTLQKILVREGYEVETAAGGYEALNSFKEKKADVVITDIKMPDMDGLQLFREIRQIDQDTSVILITAFGDIQSAVQAMSEGAAYYLTKPVDDINHLKVIIKKAVENRALLQENRRLREEVTAKYDFGNIVGKSERMQEVYAALRKVSESDVTVLILGETGTGKELAARAIHYNSGRRHNPFVKVSCASTPETLLESTLFGHEKGAYTGAESREIGMFESADKGTIFLDEIGEINHGVQVKLLRFLQERKFERVGRAKTIEVDARVIAATNVDMEKAIQEGKFRPDLYYRLNVVTIFMPPLRERREDIPLLVDHFLGKYKEKAGGKVRQVTPEAMSALMAHDWPGNVRELENSIERAIVMGDDDAIQPSDLPISISKSADIAEADETMDSIPDGSMSLDQLEESLMKRYIIWALKKAGGNQTQAAKLLNIERRKLQYRMGKYGISARDFSEN